VLEVVPHSPGGLHATLASGFGATSHAVAAALGYTSFAVTERHYVDRATLAQARSRRSREVLFGRIIFRQLPTKSSYRRPKRSMRRATQKGEKPWNIQSFSSARTGT
jgi:hypothetical protein